MREGGVGDKRWRWERGSGPCAHGVFPNLPICNQPRRFRMPRPTRTRPGVDSRLGRDSLDGLGFTKLRAQSRCLSYTSCMRSRPTSGFRLTRRSFTQTPSHEITYLHGPVRRLEGVVSLLISASAIFARSSTCLGIASYTASNIAYRSPIDLTGKDHHGGPMVVK
jgi:hypothetical protein